METTPPSRTRRISSGRLGLVCGILALVVSLGAPSEAAKLINGKLLKNNSVAGKKLKNSTVTGAKVKANTLTGADVKADTLTGSDVNEATLGAVPSARTAQNVHWAIVDSDGSLVRGSDAVIDSHKRDTGFYDVTISRSVARCAYFAQMGRSTRGLPGLGFAATAPFEDGPGVLVITAATNGTWADRQFSLLVVC